MWRVVAQLVLALSHCSARRRTFRARLEQSRDTVRSAASLTAYESSQSFTTDFTGGGVQVL